MESKMTKLDLAVEIASVLFMKRVSAVNWKVRDLMRLNKPTLEDLYRMAEKADPKFGIRERCAECYSEPCMCGDEVVPGYTRKQVADAFSGVQNTVDWKEPIDAWIPRDQLDLISAAVVYFTATPCRVVGYKKREAELHIHARGYRRGPAGDH